MLSEEGPAEEDNSKQKGQSMRKTFDHRILYEQMDDARTELSEHERS